MAIVLHGMGGSGDNTVAKWAERLNKEFIVLCPSYPMGAWWARPAEDMVLALIDHIRSLYNVDDNRVFLAGLRTVLSGYTPLECSTQIGLPA